MIDILFHHSNKSLHHASVQNIPVSLLTSRSIPSSTAELHNWAFEVLVLLGIRNSEPSWIKVYGNIVYYITINNFNNLTSFLIVLPNNFIMPGSLQNTKLQPQS